MKLSDNITNWDTYSDYSIIDIYWMDVHTQVQQPLLNFVERPIKEDVDKMESTLLTLTVRTRNHSMFIATTNIPSSREDGVLVYL